ncbi:RNA-binding protein 45 [Biomphalaria glabrata]
MVAMEALTGMKLRGSAKALKVYVANRKKDGSIRDPEEYRRLVTLCVSVPKQYSEQDIIEKFTIYGHIMEIKMIDFGESQECLAFLTFKRPFQAAKAFEACPKNFLAKFSIPKDLITEAGISTDFSQTSSRAKINTNRSYRHQKNGRDQPAKIELHKENICAHHQSSSLRSGRIKIEFPDEMTLAMVQNICSLLPGIKDCELINTGVALATFCCQRGAEYGSLKLNGFQLCNKSSLKVVIINEEQLLSQPSYTRIALPEAHPQVVQKDQNKMFRVVILADRSEISEQILIDLMSRFKNLIDVFLLRNRKMACAIYSCRKSALQAVETLNNQIVCDQTIEVLSLEPPSISPKHVQFQF